MSSASSPQPSSDFGTLAWRVAQLEQDRRDLRESLDCIRGSLEVVRALEIHHTETRAALNRGETKMNDHESRVRGIEAALPVIRLTSRWVIGGVIGIFALVAMAAFRLVVAPDLRPPAVPAAVAAAGIR